MKTIPISSPVLLAVVLALIIGVTGCKTKGDLQREAEVRQLRYDLSTKANRRDSETQQLQTEITRLSGLVEQVFQKNQQLEQQLAQMQSELVEMQQAQKAPPPSAPPPVREEESATVARAQRYMNDRNYAGAVRILKRVLAGSPSKKDKRHSEFLLAECYYADEDYARAALTFASYKKNYPRDSWVPKAIYRQANSFRKMKKNKEARLFYQELIDRFPKSTLVSKARTEMRRLK